MTSGNTVEKMGASTSTSWKGGGSNGRATPRPTSTVTETFASTRTREPSTVGPGIGMLVVFTYGGLGSVTLLPVWLPQFACALVDSFASKRGRFIETSTSAFNLSANSKPIGIEGLKARPRRISTSVTFTLNGSGVSDDAGKPLTRLFVISESSTRMLERSGT